MSVKQIAIAAAVSGIAFYAMGRYSQRPEIPAARAPVASALAAGSSQAVAESAPASTPSIPAPFAEQGQVAQTMQDGQPARGSVVDDAALIDALREKRILTAALDVFTDEPNVPQALIEMDHVVLAPHVGSASHHTRDAMGQLVVDNLLSFAAGKGPLTPVPETPWPKAGK